ncbi:hypothetical protein D3C84_782340 [compost metagenome]
MFRESGKPGAVIRIGGQALAGDRRDGVQLGGYQGPGHMVEKITLGLEQLPLQFSPGRLFLDALR